MHGAIRSTCILLLMMGCNRVGYVKHSIILTTDCIGQGEVQVIYSFKTPVYEDVQEACARDCSTVVSFGISDSAAAESLGEVGYSQSGAYAPPDFGILNGPPDDPHWCSMLATSQTASSTCTRPDGTGQCTVTIEQLQPAPIPKAWNAADAG